MNGGCGLTQHLLSPGCSILECFPIPAEGLSTVEGNGHQNSYLSTNEEFPFKRLLRRMGIRSLACVCCLSTLTGVISQGEERNWKRPFENQYFGKRQSLELLMNLGLANWKSGFDVGLALRYGLRGDVTGEITIHQELMFLNYQHYLHFRDNCRNSPGNYCFLKWSASIHGILKPALISR